MNNLSSSDQFAKRHIGISPNELQEMLQTIQADSLEQLIEETVPTPIRLREPLALPEAMTEYEYLQELKQTAALNKTFKSYIGQGYFGTITPSVLLRNIFQNPGWYTQYTPYQAEIAQGRLEALLNFQTMVSDLTGLPIANASLLDEATAAAEAMAMFHALKAKKNAAANEFFVSDKTSPATLDVLIARAEPMNILVKTGDWKTFQLTDKIFGVFLSYPDSDGGVADYADFVAQAHSKEVYIGVAADLLSLALLTPPGEWGADAVVGNSQRFGVPMGFGGPHAAFFAVKDEFKRHIPGRIIGVSVDARQKRALRMALQTREQHIRREKATSNICTAQALLAIMAGAYAAYHGPQGIREIAQQVHSMAVVLEKSLKELGFAQSNAYFFDTLHIPVPNPETLKAIQKAALRSEINFYYGKDFVQIALDETVSKEDLWAIHNIFEELGASRSPLHVPNDLADRLPERLRRESAYLTHPVFNSHHTETKMMRYLKRLENKDLSLTHSMISLGSCTMKLNAATELIPVSWDAFANIHPFAPLNQTLGYQKIFKELEQWLCAITGFDACSLQPNSGAQGEYAGLLTIRAFHLANGQPQRTVALIPSSAHGTNRLAP